jgi:predicted ArsR family transcriptional regulator
MAASGRPGTRAALLEVLTAARRPLSSAELASATGMHVNTVRPHLEILVHTGAAARSADAGGRPGRPVVRYRAVPAEPEAPAPEPAGLLPDDAVQRLAGLFVDLGFAAEVDAVGDRVLLRACPVAALATQDPHVCEMHLQLAQAALARTRSAVRVERLDVQVRPGLCVLHLGRPDLRPTRVIDPRDAAGPGSRGDDR